MKKTVIALLVLVLTFSLAACGSTPAPTEAPTEVPAETTTAPVNTNFGDTNAEWGCLKFYLPEGYDYSTGTFGDATDENSIIIQCASDGKIYYAISRMSQGEAEGKINNIEQQKNGVSIEPVSDGVHTWHGIVYQTEDGLPIYVISTVVGSDALYVKTCGVELGDQNLLKALASLQIK